MTQTPVQLKNSHQSLLSVDEFSALQNNQITSKKSVQKNNLSLSKKLLLIILPTALGSLAFSNLINYLQIQEQTEAKVKLQLENEVIFVGETTTQLVQEKFNIDKTLELISTSLSKTDANLASRSLQIISAQTEVALQTINGQEINQNQEIIGGKNLIATAKLIQSNNVESLENQLKQQDLYQKIIVNQAKSVVSFIYQNRFYTFFPIANTDLVAVSSLDLSELAKYNQELRANLIFQNLLLGTIVTIIIVLATSQIVKPLSNLVKSSEKVFLGELNLLVQGKDTLETQSLRHNFNNLIIKFQQLLQKQKTEAQQAKILKEIIIKTNQSLDDLILKETLVQQINLALKTDRVVYCQINNLQQGEIVAESITTNYASILGNSFKVEDYLPKNRFSIVQNIERIETALLSKSQQQQLQSWQVQAMLVAPVLVNQKLDGFLMIQSCATPRHWQPQEIDFVEQIAYQLSFAATRDFLLQQQQNADLKQNQAQEKLKQEVLNLIQKIQSLYSGDLTLRANLTSDEIGKIAEAYNMSIENLQQLISNFKTTVAYVEENAIENQQIIQNLTTETVQNAAKINQTQKEIQLLNEANYLVKTHASQAEVIAKQANLKISAGNFAIASTVEEINFIQETVDVASEKIKLLGDSSQEISQAVNLIARFAAQTHLLALKASIEAARAGEQGRGFAVIADEVRTLATQSAGASAEIENLVAKIQQETQAVVEVMAKGTNQVKTGAELVQQTRQSLSQVANATSELQQLVDEIALASHQQIVNSESVMHNITDAAMTATQNTQSVTQLSASLCQLSEVTEQLKQHFGKFKT
ncbi:methyl-accepting chemotaxis sensory transducer with GAF sensor [Stanieria cyanosphaera PCC 7437]|uniref:Methyl-accepting chemotaxis sensory transducer with GAF sensor n=1 Tax=Stanieria cyanosphaera (strain ATCC 29371 / PCC 7437) TaxID=111780 RepID=K9Y0G4_STAC7|nr:methyl-accepting chemotaxis protein [Stanieria cyanosphaera]AFZ37886.1 methyl-accepting chemotaxis sensory transducer with GAF sensor [Stanieria cyanosphaera PCC 7437]